MSKEVIQKFKFECNSKEEANEIIKDFKPSISTQWLSVPTDVYKRCSPEACFLYSHILGFSSGLYRGSNTALAKLMSCSTRTIARLMNELQEKKCIKVVIVSRTTRLIYPVYTLPFIMDIESSSKSNKKELKDDYRKVDTGDFEVL